MKKLLERMGWVVAGTLLCWTAGAEDPWADAVTDYTPNPSSVIYGDSSLALGPPEGRGGNWPDNSSIVTIGVPPGSITLQFNTPVTDDPLNPFGVDCIVYSNAFYVGGNPQKKWQEPALIEISDDGVNWYLIPGSRDYAYSPFPLVTEPDGTDNESPFSSDLLGGNVTNPNILDADPSNDEEEYNWGYAEMSPSQQPYLDNYVRPDDPAAVGVTTRSGGGDAFDIAWAVDAAGDPAGLTQFQYIRLTAFIDRYANQFGYISPEIDAVADVAPEVDSDGDGILDEYETRVAGTDPTRPESTVLPLEIPSSEGGSPAGTLLGTARDSRGTLLRLYSSGGRTDDNRAFNCIVDILEPAEPGAVLPSGDLLKSGAVRQFVSSESDFTAANIAPARITIEYESSDITGLDEDSLQPYINVFGAYSQLGISDIELNAAANRITFSAQHAGTYILASVAGTGDPGVAGPTGTITLSAWPEDETAADPAESLSVTSGVIYSHAGPVVPDGTLITVAADLGTIATADADAGEAGVQVATSAGVIGFDVQAPQQAGSALFTATSVQGNAYGELTYSFVPGLPSGTIEWEVGEPDGEGPVTVTLTSSIVTDQFGNVVRDGTLLTVTISGGVITSGDASSALSGHQVVVQGGLATVSVQVAAQEDTFALDTYADEGQSLSLGSGAYGPADYTPMPMAWAPLLMALLVLGNLLAWLRFGRSKGAKS